MKNTYQVVVSCTNCRHEWIKDIPKGQGSHRPFMCPNCGCNEGVSKGKPINELLFTK